AGPSGAGGVVGAAALCAVSVLLPVATRAPRAVGADLSRAIGKVVANAMARLTLLVVGAGLVQLALGAEVFERPLRAGSGVAIIGVRTRFAHRTRGALAAEVGLCTAELALALAVIGTGALGAPVRARPGAAGVRPAAEATLALGGIGAGGTQRAVAARSQLRAALAGADADLLVAIP